MSTPLRPLPAVTSAQLAAEQRRRQKGARNLRNAGLPPPLAVVKPVTAIDGFPPAVSRFMGAAGSLAKVAAEAAWCVRSGSGDLRAALATCREAARDFERTGRGLDGADFEETDPTLLPRLLDLHVLLRRMRGNEPDYWGDPAWFGPIDAHMGALETLLVGMVGAAPANDETWRRLIEHRRRLQEIPRGGDLGAVRAWLEATGSGSDGALADLILGVFWRLSRDPALLMGRKAAGAVKALQARGLKRIVVYDPDATPIEGALVIPDVYQARNAIALSWGNKPQFVAIRDLGDPLISDATKEELHGYVQRGIEISQICTNTIDLFGEVWALQGMENLPRIASYPTIGIGKGAFGNLSIAKTGLSSTVEGSPDLPGPARSTPAVIIATGPSLSKNIHHLKALKGKALLITFSHSLGALKKAGIVPDLVLALDPEDLRYHFDGYDTTQPEALVLGATIHPDVLRLPSKRTYTFAANAGIDNWLYCSIVGGKNAAEGERQTIASGGSVACTATSLAKFWGCDPIVYVGLDLSYPDGKVYAEGTCDDSTTLSSADGKVGMLAGWSEQYSRMASINGAKGQLQQVTEVAGYYGGKVPSSVAFTGYREWIETFILQYGVTAWNCTEGGARVANCEQLPLSEAVQRIEAMGVTCDAGATLDARLAATGFDPAARRKLMLSQVEDMIGRVERSRETAQAALECANDPARREEQNRHGRELERLVNQVPYLIQAQQKHLAQYDDDVEQTPDEIGEGASRNYRLVIEAAEKMRPVLDRAAEELRQ